MIVIKNADLYAPEHLGISDILVEGSKIAKISKHITEYDDIPEVTVLDLGGKRVVPGYIDNHVHITGGGGEKGPSTRVPEAQTGQIFASGITTVVGLLGTDSITRSLENLLAKCRALNEEGLTCYMLTGSYTFPAPTLTGSVERDIVLIDRVIGVKTSMSDHRSSNQTAQDLIFLATQARRGGLLADCAGVVTIHMGSGKKGLTPLMQALEESDVPAKHFLPTHIGRTPELFRQGMEFVALGGTVDITAGSSSEAQTATVDKIVRYFEEDPSGDHMSMSSDGYGSSPKFNEAMECIGLTYASPDALHAVIKRLVIEKGIPLENAVKLVTKTPARVLGLAGKKGCIAVGADADMVVYDEEMNLSCVIASGKIAMRDGQVIMKGPYED